MCCADTYLCSRALLLTSSQLMSLSPLKPTVLPNPLRMSREASHLPRAPAGFRTQRRTLLLARLLRPARAASRCSPAMPTHLRYTTGSPHLGSTSPSTRASSRRGFSCSGPFACSLCPASLRRFCSQFISVGYLTPRKPRKLRSRHPAAIKLGQQRLRFSGGVRTRPTSSTFKISDPDSITLIAQSYDAYDPIR